MESASEVLEAVLDREITPSEAQDWLCAFRGEVSLNVDQIEVLIHLTGSESYGRGLVAGRWDMLREMEAHFKKVEEPLSTDESDAALDQCKVALDYIEGQKELLEDQR